MAISSKEWLSCILNEQGLSYYVDANGVVKTSSTPKPLKHMPNEWQEIELNYGRSSKYFGLERNFTSAYKFVKDGAKIIRNAIYNRKGIEEKLYFCLLKWNNTNGKFELYYKSEIDLTISDDTPNIGFDVSMIEGGAAKVIKANESTIYEIPVNELTVNMTSVLFSDKFNYYIPEAGSGSADRYAVGVTFVNNEGSNINIAQGFQSQEDVADADYNAFIANSPNYLIKAYQTTVLRVQGSIRGQAFGTDTFELAFVKTGDIRTYIFNQSVSNGFDQTVNFDFNVTLNVGEALFLMHDGTFVGRTNQSGNFSISFDSMAANTETLAIRPINLFKALVNKMSEGKYTAESTLLEDNEHLVVCSGDNLRGIANGVVKTSFVDFYDSFSRILGGAIGVRFSDNTILFEDREYFFDNTNEIIDLGEVSDLSISVAKDFLYSKVKVGYASNKQDENIAKQAFNAMQNYTTPITRINKELDLSIKYITDCFTIESVRKDYLSKENTDSPNDNSVFILNINRTPEINGKYELYRPAYSLIEGVSNPSTVYNIEQLTPKRIVIANGDLLSGSLYKLPTDKVTFTSADKNKALITTLAGETINEGGNLRIDTLQNSWYRPFIFKFKTKVPTNIINLLQQAGKGYIKFSWNGIELYGFPYEVSVKPIYEEAQEWKLLCSSLTDPAIFETINTQYISIEDKGMISHKLPVKFIRVGASYPLQYHFKQMDTDWFSERVQNYAGGRTYFQKWQTNDSFDIQFITEGLAVDVKIIDCNQQVIDTITMNAIVDPVIINPMQCFQGTVDCSVLDNGKVYYILATFGTGGTAKQFISEPMAIATDWQGTLLIESSNDANQKDIVWSSGFTTKIRVEGNIQKFRPDSKFTNYEDQPLNTVFIDGEASRSYELFVGGDAGLPDWVIDKVNRLLLLDNVLIDGYDYQMSEGAKLEPVEVLGSALSYWAINIVEANNKLGIAIDAAGENVTDLTVIYNINTKGFSSENSPNANQQDNIVQVTEIE